MNYAWKAALYFTIFEGVFWFGGGERLVYAVKYLVADGESFIQFDKSIPAVFHSGWEVIISSMAILISLWALKQAIQTVGNYFEERGKSVKGAY